MSEALNGHRSGSEYIALVPRAARRCYLLGASDTVFVVSTGGQPLTRWKAGLLNGNPGKMAIGLDGSLYVADVSTIRHFTGDGAPLGVWGTEDIGGVWGLGVDAQGRIYVAADATQQIVRYVPWDARSRRDFRIGPQAAVPENRVAGSWLSDGYLDLMRTLRPHEIAHPISHGPRVPLEMC